ncbi:hypothetical protein, partial [Bacteroides pyogenes]|uniref:hypothetical protein n=1 Tax=Bacteroides pyogenes TaxID=310300 RepID=UPI001F3C75E5
MSFITDIQGNTHYIVSRGHTFILCICPSDKNNEVCTIHLPFLDREGFLYESRPLQNLTPFSIILVFEHYWLTCSLY